MTQEPKAKQPDVPPPRRNRAHAVAASAAPLGSEAFARAGFRDPTLVLRWAEIAGPEVARIAQPFRLSQIPAGAVLTLKAEPAAALFLQHESRALLERINGYLGTHIVRLKFVQAPFAARPTVTVPPRPPGDVPSNDPARAFRGPEPVRDALIKLARRRAALPRPD